MNTKHISLLERPYSVSEVKESLFSIDGDKSPGPDGMGAHFYKDTWAVIGDEVTLPVLNFLEHGCLLKELNATILTFVLKVACPSNVNEFRLIACCNGL